MDNYKIITEEKNLQGKKVLLRLDLNVPLENGTVVNDFRIKKSLETLNFLRENGAKVIILAHIGRDVKESLRPVYECLKNIIPTVGFVPDIFSEDARVSVDAMNDGDVILFENLRQHKSEEENDLEFAKHLASFGDIYVDEAFSNAHRNHVSMVGLPKLLPHYAGIHFDREVRMISRAFNPPSPLLVVVGGAKFETKLPLIKKFSSVANNVFVGGALANDIYRFYGFELGKSLVSDTPMSEIAELIDTGRILSPDDVVISTNEVKDPKELSPEDQIVDAGPQSLEVLSDLISNAKLIIWNGPLGLYEKGFTNATDSLMKMIMNSNVEAIVGGGDTAVAAERFEGVNEQVFISTGGGAMLDFLSEGSLVGIEALKSE